MIGPKGKFMLEPDDDRTHLFISSGTGNAPFVSMMRETLAAGAPRRAVFLNGVSHVRDLGYRDIARGLGGSRRVPGDVHPDRLAPRRPANAGWTGRTGRVEIDRRAGLRGARADPDDTIAYLCGNPDMILAAEQTLLGLGFAEAAVKKELYWPKGKEPRGAGGRRRRGRPRRPQRGRVVPPDQPFRAVSSRSRMSR